MEEFDIHSFEQRLGKFEGIQQQHDQRLADIESRLGNIEVMLTDVRTEGHREREALRTELVGLINENRNELVGLINQNRNELIGLITEERSERETLRTELAGLINGNRTELVGLITEERSEREILRTDLTRQIELTRTELNKRIDQLSNKIDGLYKWIIGILIAVGASVIAAVLKGFFG